MRRPTISGLATAAVVLALTGVAMAQGGQARGTNHFNTQGMYHFGMNKPGGQGAARKPAQDGRSHPPAQQQGSQQRRSN